MLGNQPPIVNADSFAIAFDEAWNKFNSSKNVNVPIEDKLEEVLESLKENPYISKYPDQALQIAKFRIRLLELK